MVSPADGNGKNLEEARSGTKNESNPETAKYSGDAKELEGIENKTGKPGFNVVVNVVVSAETKESAEAHLSNITSSCQPV